MMIREHVSEAAVNEESNKSPISCREQNMSRTRRVAVGALMTAMATVLMYIEIPLPFMPSFLKYDLSEVPILIAAFAFGPLTAIVIELLKNLIMLAISNSSMGIGQLANFAAGVAFAGSAGLVYRYMKSRKGALISMLIGTLVLSVTTPLLNYYVFLELYARFMGFSTEAIVGMTQAVNSLVIDKRSLIFFAFVPFNLFKGLTVSLITFIVYKPISKKIHGNNCKA